MQTQTTSGRVEFVGQVVSRDDMPAEALAMQEDRERRRIEFRSSLVRARAAHSRMEGREMAQQSMRQLAAGFVERRPARMMADLAGAR
jgi:site-specific recombinase